MGARLRAVPIRLATIVARRSPGHVARVSPSDIALEGGRRLDAHRRDPSFSTRGTLSAKEAPSSLLTLSVDIRAQWNSLDAPAVEHPVLSPFAGHLRREEA
jgi:hypothetical protein